MQLVGAGALDRLVGAVEAGHAAAAIVVTRHGADPPTLADLRLKSTFASRMVPARDRRKSRLRTRE